MTGAAALQGGRVLARRIPRSLLAIVFLLAVFWQMSVQAPLLNAGAPYEAWDEIATYNTSRVLTGPTATWAFRYGTLDSLIQVIATQYFLLFDPLGAEFHHIAYSNNDYGSLNDEFYAFTKITSEEMGYNYFRGLDDHRPIALSRQLHFYVFYALVAGAGLLWITILRLEAVWLLLPMLCLLVNKGLADQSVLALPNAINAILTFIIVALIALSLETRRHRLLYLAAAGLAVALNFKVDVLPLGAILGLPLIWYGTALRPIHAGRLILTATIVFLGTLVMTKPDLVTAPESLRYWLFPPVSTSQGDWPAIAGHNLAILARILKVDMLPGALQSHVPTWVLPFILAVGLAVAFGVLRRQKAILGRLALPTLATAILWLVPVAVLAKFYDRYELNGLAAFYALTGVLALCLFRYGATQGRRLACAGMVLMAGQFGLMIRDGAAYSTYLATRTNVVMWGEGNKGYALDHSRNLIEARAINTVMGGGYATTILVDQHGYLDLRPLRLAGLTPIYVNVDSLATVLAAIDPSIPHLLLLSAGSYEIDPAWWAPQQGQWSAELKRRYDAYRARLDAFPMLADAGDLPQRLLWNGPVEPRDRMVLAVVPPLAPVGTVPATHDEVAKSPQPR
ncbi:MAG: hypothetical protein WCC64_21715 [Aliidongia sp.]